jgi:3-hydroxyisobutyrate dehydrogenase-like beta-hydroxyacid dehydrogenase
MTIVSIIAPGAMGAAVGARLVEHGVQVRTTLTGRSPASGARARDSGIHVVDGSQLVDSDIILSIVPPGQALSVAESLAPLIAASVRKPAYADCNAISPTSAEIIARVIAGCGARFVDAGIIGGPPKPGAAGPVFYTSGSDAPALEVLGQHGLRVRDLRAPIGAASSLKMSYAGITKGLTALGAAMMLAATRAGVAPALAAELADSQPEVMAWLARSIPDMYAKAHRWVAEMDEIAVFAAEDPPTHGIYKNIAARYQALAEDQAGPKLAVEALDAFLHRH